MRFQLLVVLGVFLASAALGQENPLWLRYPAISPDGQTVLFCFKGDIDSVLAAGGAAVPLTLSESYEFAPVWSHDGKSIAFASDRYGNFDVFVMPSAGGKIGYVHVRAMSDASMRTVFEEALGRNVGKDAIVVDTRFNGGGNIHEQLSDFPSGMSRRS